MNIDDVSWGRPDSRTTRTAAATASDTEPSSPAAPSGPTPDGDTLNATITPPACHGSTAGFGSTATFASP
ncbi:hypothetical protein GCM10023200_41860 [Actinomycetospora chlora]|uniref:Uncharacterized protein n=1 Tax=Actinomycetospora chlora TaxID=663608 RepID=A0ABP9BY52_9PSEU